MTAPPPNSPSELRCMLIGMRGGGGEEPFVRELVTDPPPGVRYTAVFDPHENAEGARARAGVEVAFNRIVHPFLWPLPGLRAYDVDERFDLVHVHVHMNRIRRPRGVPIVMSVSNSYYHYIQDYLGWPAARVDRRYARARRLLPGLGIANELASWRLLSGISVFSEFAREALIAHGVPGGLVTVIPPGFHAPVATPRTPSAAFTFLFAGRDPWRKGADLVVAAIRDMRARGLEVRAILAGDDSFLELAHEPGFDVYGPVSRTVLMERLFPAADAFVMPSRAEGYGFALLEAMAFGLPVVSSTYGSIPEVVDHGSTGLLVPPGDAAALLKTMQALAIDSTAAAEMGKQGRRRFDEHFTRDKFLARMRAWYDSVVEAR